MIDDSVFRVNNLILKNKLINLKQIKSIHTSSLFSLIKLIPGRIIC